MIRVGIVGFGFMGRTHLECYRANDACEVTTVVTRDPLRRQGKPVGLGNLPVGTNPLDVRGLEFRDHWQDLVNDTSIDLIDICAPTDLHAPIAIAALGAGKHVLVEKPMARTADDAAAMVEAARKAGRILHVGHVLHYWGQYVEAAHLAARTDLGRLRSARFERFGGRPAWSADNWLANPARSGGAVLDMGIHDIDAALWMFGPPIETHVIGRCEGVLPVSMDATWFYKKQAQVHLHCRWDNQSGLPFRYGFALEFDRATLSCESAQGAGLTIIEGGQATEMPFNRRLPYQAQIDDVLESIAAGRPHTSIRPEDALASTRVALEHLRQIEDSAKQT